MQIFPVANWATVGTSRLIYLCCCVMTIKMHYLNKLGGLRKNDFRCFLLSPFLLQSSPPDVKRTMM